MYCVAVTAGYHCCLKQVIARRDDMPPPIAADLRPCADGSAVRTALLAWPRRGAPSWPRWDRQTGRQTDGWTDSGIAECLVQRGPLELKRSFCCNFLRRDRTGGIITAKCKINAFVLINGTWYAVSFSLVNNAIYAMYFIKRIPTLPMIIKLTTYIYTSNNYDTIRDAILRYDTIRDAILTCARKPT